MMTFFTCAGSIFTLFAALIWAGSIPYEDDGILGWIILGVEILSGITGLVLAFVLSPDGMAIGIVCSVEWALLMFLIFFVGIVLGHGSTGPGSF